MTKKSKRAIRKRQAKLLRASRGLPMRSHKPRRRIKADLSKQAPNNSFGPPLYYEDQTFECRDCGKVETWTAVQQQQYFEIWKRPIYGVAVRCRACRKLRKAAKR